jgi:hypothetical protein
MEEVPQQLLVFPDRFQLTDHRRVQLGGVLRREV